MREGVICMRWYNKNEGIICIHRDDEGGGGKERKEKVESTYLIIKISYLISSRCLAHAEPSRDSIGAPRRLR